MKKKRLKITAAIITVFTVISILIVIAVISQNGLRSPGAVNVKNRILIDVPFVSQYPPGTSWKDTKNCCQTSYIMLKSFYECLKPSKDDIKSIDDWIYKNMKKPVNNYNGTPLFLRELKDVAAKHGNFKVKYQEYCTYKKVIRSLTKNIPVITSVYYPSPGDPDKKIHHALVIVGIDNDFVWVNDPGRTYGKNVKYPIADFTSYWGMCRREALIIEPR